MSTPGSDDIRRWSEELARDPSSFVFLQLGEALRRRGQSDLALKVALRGLERHSHNADAHDLLARIAADRKELERAFDEWDMVMRLQPGHPGALKGMGFVRFQERRFEEAERYLAAASEADPTDGRIKFALAMVREELATRDSAVGTRHPAGETEGIVPTPAAPAAEPPVGAAAAAAEPAPSAESRAPSPGFSDARTLFHDVVSHGQSAMLLDANGFVLAGSYTDRQGADLSEEIGANLSGVSDEANRAVRHLQLGDWSSIVFETDAATVAMTPLPGGGLALVAADRATPQGFVRRLLERVGERARKWAEGQP
ncbi:MAG TPA: roadblock/LC7 domain-containing protein [Gemmatimonadaceae bacterium]|nr:roadblock/LC7 domain-containing protein [Gemmatimonadaceae bacterium]